ncbi:MAG: hypothetical protein AAF649_00845 [Verrucomicrobiota bacterium]
MKATYSFIIVLALSVAISIQAETISAPDSTYSDPNLKSILLNIEDYKNDRVTYKAVYGGFAKNAPEYFENNARFREGKDVLIRAGSLQLPVVGELDDMKPVLETLRNGALVQLSGKIKELDRERKRGIGCGYYLELEGFTVLDENFRQQAQRHAGLKPGKKKGKAFTVKDGEGAGSSE